MLDYLSSRLTPEGEASSPGTTEATVPVTDETAQLRSDLKIARDEADIMSKRIKELEEQLAAAASVAPRDPSAVERQTEPPEAPPDGPSAPTPDDVRPELAHDLLQKHGAHIPEEGESKEHFIETELSKTGMSLAEWLKVAPQLIKSGAFPRDRVAGWDVTIPQEE